MWLPVAGRSKEWRVTTNGYWVSFGGDKNILELHTSDDCTTLLIYNKLLNCALKGVNTIVCEFYLKF